MNCYRCPQLILFVMGLVSGSLLAQERELIRQEIAVVDSGGSFSTEPPRNQVQPFKSSIDQVLAGRDESLGRIDRPGSGRIQRVAALPRFSEQNDRGLQDDASAKVVQRAIHEADQRVEQLQEGAPEMPLPKTRLEAIGQLLQISLEASGNNRKLRQQAICSALLAASFESQSEAGVNHSVPASKDIDTQKLQLTMLLAENEGLRDRIKRLEQQQNHLAISNPFLANRFTNVGPTAPAVAKVSYSGPSPPETVDDGFSFVDAAIIREVGLELDQEIKSGDRVSIISRFEINRAGVGGGAMEETVVSSALVSRVTPKMVVVRASRSDARKINAIHSKGKIKLVKVD